jgi:hypothetical protein
MAPLRRVIVRSNVTLIRRRPIARIEPQENIWQFLRDNWLSNRIFKF